MFVQKHKQKCQGNKPAVQTNNQKPDPSPTKKRHVLKTNLAPQSVPRIVDNRLPGENEPCSSEVVRIRRTPTDSDELNCLHNNRTNDNDDEVNEYFFVLEKNGKNGSINMPRSVSTNRHVCSKKYNPNNVSVRKIEGGPRTEPSRPAAAARARGETDLAWRRSSPFHKSGVSLGAQTHLRGSTI